VTAQSRSDPQRPPAATQVLSYHLDMLKLEIETISNIIDRMDRITQATKNWAVVTWAGGVGLALRERELRPFLVLTAVLPMLFWYIDAVWRRLQARSTYRMFRIRDFLNSEGLVRAFEAGCIQDFVLLDPVGTQYKGAADCQKHVSLQRTLRYREVAVFYAVPILVSIFLGLFFVLFR